MKIIFYISRYLVALTFIFSGFVKLVDPLGSTYKFQEYFGSDVLNMEFLIPYALPFSIVLILAEITLGLMLFVGYKPKITVWSIFVLTLVFLFLTWYSAYYDKVTDCGCFGDAIKLSSWGTFYKNIGLIILVVIIVLKVNSIRPLLNLPFARWITFLFFVFFLYLTYHVLIHLPIIDFRPYAIGNNIEEGMKYIGDEEPPIHDFLLESIDGADLTEEVLSVDKMMLIVSYNLDKANLTAFLKIKKITDEALEKGYTVYLASASMNETYMKVKSEFNLNFDMLFCDETALKTIIRANPGVLTLNKGTVTGKWNGSDSDTIILN